jgi:hypothetical protein
MLMALSVIAFITLAGFHLPAISPQLFADVAAIAVIYFFTLDWFKVWLFARLQLR